VHLRFTDPTFCDFSADGTGAAAGNGTVRFRYVNDTGRLQILRTGSTLHIYSVKGCGGAFHDGDTAALSSISMITPVQTITGPLTWGGVRHPLASATLGVSAGDCPAPGRHD
jgi:hypothetical protein